MNEDKATRYQRSRRRASASGTVLTATWLLLLMVTGWSTWLREVAETLAGPSFVLTVICYVILVAVLSVLKDHGVFSRMGIVQPLIAAALVPALVWSGRSWAPSWAWQPILPGGLAPWSGLSDATVLAGIAALTLTLAMGARRDHPNGEGTLVGAHHDPPGPSGTAGSDRRARAVGAAHGLTTR